VFEDARELLDAVGTELGPGPAHAVTQEMIDMFADATGDHQWIHVDTARAAAGPFGTTVAHGFLTLSLIPVLAHELYEVAGVRLAVNYGLNRVRFPAPVRAGDSVRAHIAFDGVDEVGDAVQVKARITISVDGQTKPACVAEMLSRHYT